MNRNNGAQGIYVIVAIFMSMLMTGCAESMAEKKMALPEDHGEVKQHARLIIKFTQQQTGEQLVEKLNQLGQEYKVKLNLVRQMHGDTFVITVSASTDDQALATMIKSIQARDDVVYIERDVLMQHQLNQPSLMLKK